ncbi:MAG: hypothetical protein MI861_28240 [Pirellulales bacterium]|nr:hypothetical protein [Pirellulales bacterium]
MSSASPHRIDSPSLAFPHVDRAGRPEPQPSGGLDNSSAAADKKTSADQPAEPENLHRVDGSHQLGSDIPTPDWQPTAAEESRVDPSSPQQWLQCHAIDLIQKLQQWADDLDAREAQLNWRSAAQDRRERQFRPQQQDLVAEMAEQQRSVQRLQAEAESQARRLAFAESPHWHEGRAAFES